MKNFFKNSIRLLLGLSLVLLVQCQKDDAINVFQVKSMEGLNVATAKAELVALIKEKGIKPLFQIETKPFNSRLNPSSLEQRTSPANSLLSNADYLFYKNLINRVIDPGDYECGPTFIDGYVNNSIANWTSDDFLFYNYFGGVSLDYAYVFHNSKGGEYYGSNGQFSKAVTKTFGSLLSFWDIPTDIIAGDAHGSIYKDIPKVVSILELYGYPSDDALYFAELLKIVFGSANFQNYNHPLLTFNAFAAEPDYFNPVKKIIMGDGIMQAYEDLGYGDVAPQAILAHEYGHHIQFANGYFNQPPSPEATRRTELMADAFSAYYLTSKRGATMNWKRVAQFLQVFYSIGDCSFGSGGHHGTPNQRMKAATFGYQVANEIQKKGHILSSEEFYQKFEAALPGIVAPDSL